MSNATLLRWIAGDDTGMSSKAIWSHMMTGEASREGMNGVAHPLDAGDFGRCYRLLLLAPEWEARIGEMGRYSAEWKALAERWPEMNRLYEAAVKVPSQKTWDRRNFNDAALKEMCDVMADLLTKARVCAQCGKVGMNSWTTYANDVKRCYDCSKKFDAKHPRARSASSIRLGEGVTMSFE